MAGSGSQLPLLQPDSDWSPPDTLPSLSCAERISVDLETHDPGLREYGAGWARGEGHIVGISVATDDYCGYFPIAHEHGGNLDRGVVMRWLKEELSRPHQPKVFANAMYDVGWLLRENVIVSGKLYDVQIAEPLLDEQRLTYRLDALARDYLGERKDEKLLREAAKSWGVDPKAGLSRMPACFVGPYAEQDAALPLKIFDTQRKKLEDEGLWDLFELETELLPMLIAMRFRGVRVNVEEAGKLANDWRQKEDDLLQAVAREYSPIDPWNAASISKAFDKQGLHYERTEAGNPSFRSDWLLAHDHPLPATIAQIRKLNKARSTFVEGYVIDQNRNGRIHCEFHPLRSDNGGTVSGRFSCSNPNLQNIPARDPDIGPHVRRLFLPEEGCEWLSADYSQQEPRLTVHYAAMMDLPGADEAVRFYRNDPDADYHKMVADMAGIPRKQAKTINLGLAYGMGRAKLASNLGIALSAAEKLFEQYHERVPFVRAITEAASRRAAKQGVIRTLLGRRCRFNSWEPADFDLAQARWKKKELRKPLTRMEAEAVWPGQPLKRSFTHSALNRLIQGSAADMTKKAMVELWRLGITPHLQIHDELCLSMESLRQGEQIIDVMKNCVRLQVPVKVDGEAGATWGDAK